jgi:diacylglycerol kinase (ATP)
MLDIVIMTKQNKLSMLVQALKQVTGFNEVQETAVFNEQSSVIYFQAPSITINNALDAPLHIDGDPVETEKQLKFQVIPSCFQLLVSKN